MNSTHIALRESLKGQHVTIPSMYKVFPEWKPQIHPQYLKARDEVLNPWIDRWVLDKRTAKGLKAADFAVFAAVWSPQSSFDVLCTAAKYFAWYFVYDDIFDCGGLKYDKKKATEYRDASLEYFKFFLCGEGSPPDLSGFDEELRNGLHCWDEVGAHICQVNSMETRRVLCDEMLRYVGSLDNVNSIFEDYETPTTEQYWERREATAAVHCVSATIPFVYGIDVTQEEMKVQAMKDLWRHTSYFVHISNDMFSFRKEVNDDQIENLIPVLMMQQPLNCHEAMQKGYSLLIEEAEGFRDAEKRLRAQNDGKSSQVNEAFIQGCLNIAMGLAHWR
ncbi:hypothetical protein N7456_001308 [Penicillium angulare]|uniref:Terpene synthase n=1 Tax=Penicillium angulare TaxID=116970 RepID=A0A9W9KSY6_9EURO|nr:hypothetical protein N7456_001308 [Penicillium angulare]